MTDKDYEQQRRECWEEFKKSALPYHPHNAIDFAFDRAYALGREAGVKGNPLDTYITGEDKENVRAEYKAMAEAYESPRNNGEKEYAKGYMEALEWLFGIRFLTNQQNDNG